MDEMHIYRLRPIAAPYDQNWDRAFNQGEVVVRARSSGEARAVAALAEEEARSAQEPPKMTLEMRASAFLDDKLYGMTEIEDGSFPLEGPPALLAGSFSFPPDTLPDHGD